MHICRFVFISSWISAWPLFKQTWILFTLDAMCLDCQDWLERPSGSCWGKDETINILQTDRHTIGLTIADDFKLNAFLMTPLKGNMAYVLFCIFFSLALCNNDLCKILIPFYYLPISTHPNLLSHSSHWLHWHLLRQPCL